MADKKNVAVATPDPEPEKTNVPAIPPKTETPPVQKPAGTLIVPAGTFAIEVYEPNALREVVQENLAGMKIGLFDLEKIKVPAGGGTHWEVTDRDGHEDSQKEIIGVILMWKFSRAYWKVSIDGGKTGPPDCKSDDSKIGIGDPGGVCDRCSLAQFGSEPKNHRGQACKQKMILLFLRPHSMFPQPVFLPPTSLKAARDYFVALSGRGKPFWSVMTSLTLGKKKNPEGIEYGEVALKSVGNLDGAIIEKVRAFGDGVKVVFGTAAPNARDMED